MSLYRMQQSSRSNRQVVDDDDIIISKSIEETMRVDYNAFLSLDDNTVNARRSKSTLSNKKKKKRSDINSDEIKSSSDNNEHVKLESTDHNINGVENDNIVVNRLGQKIIKRLNYFWGNVQRNSTKVKYESASKKSSFVIREEKIRQSLIKLFQLQYERELKEKEEKASNRMTRRLLALILHEKKNAPDNKTNNASQSITLFPSIFQKRK